MLVVGLALTFVGYSVAYYGVTQVQGGNWGLLDLMLPTRWTPDVAGLARDGK
jgi:drug/metabolite transporter (DMT)-like permease